MPNQSLHFRTQASPPFYTRQIPLSRRLALEHTDVAAGGLADVHSTRGLAWEGSAGTADVCPRYDNTEGHYAFPRLFQDGHRAIWRLPECKGREKPFMAKRFGVGWEHTVYSDEGKTGILKAFDSKTLTEAIGALIVSQEGLYAPLKLACKDTKKRTVRSLVDVLVFGELEAVHLCDCGLSHGRGVPPKGVSFRSSPHPHGNYPTDGSPVHC
jgi:hypothetical protein